MGPTNSALVNLFQADQTLREAQGRLDAASKNVRIQDRRVHDLLERLKAAQLKEREMKAKSAGLDLDLRARDAKIEKLRTQQQNAKNNKEYQAFLVEINTGKLDRGKVEEEALKLVQQLETHQQEMATIAAQLETEKGKLAEMKNSISETLAKLQAEIDQVRPARESAAGEVGKLSTKALAVYERLAERYDGEAVAHIAQPDRRNETYICTACNMELVTDIYNKLKTRDELVFCPNCGRILYAPVEMAYAQAPKAKAPATRQTKSKASGLREPGPPMDPVKAELQKLLTRAAGESTRNAVAAGNDPREFEVYIESKFFGVFKGQNIDNFRRTARFCLQEAGVIKDMDVYEKGQGPKALAASAAAAAVEAAAAAVVAPATDAGPSAADATPAEPTASEPTAVNLDDSPASPPPTEPSEDDEAVPQ